MRQMSSVRLRDLDFMSCHLKHIWTSDQDATFCKAAVCGRQHIGIHWDWKKTSSLRVALNIARSSGQNLICMPLLFHLSRTWRDTYCFTRRSFFAKLSSVSASLGQNSTTSQCVTFMVLWRWAAKSHWMLLLVFGMISSLSVQLPSKRCL